MTPGCDGAHSNPERCQISGHRQGHAEDRSLGGGVGHLSALAFHAGDRRRVDHHAPLAVLVRLTFADGGGHQPGDIERPGGIHGHGLHKRVLVVGHAAAPDGATTAHTAAGHIDENRELAQSPGRGHRRQHGVVVVHIAAHGHRGVAEFLSQVIGPIGIPVEDGHPDPDLQQPAHGRGAEPAGTPGDDG